MFLGRALVRTNRTTFLSQPAINFGRHNLSKITPAVRLCSNARDQSSRHNLPVEGQGNAPTGDVCLYDKIDNIIGGASIILVGGAMSYFCPPVTLVGGVIVCLVAERIRIVGLFLIISTVLLMWLVDKGYLPQPYQLEY